MYKTGTESTLYEPFSFSYSTETRVCRPIDHCSLCEPILCLCNPA